MGVNGDEEVSHLLLNYGDTSIYFLLYSFSTLFVCCIHCYILLHMRLTFQLNLHV